MNRTGWVLAVVGAVLLLWGLVSAFNRPEMPVSVLVGVVGALMLNAALLRR